MDRRLLLVGGIALAAVLLGPFLWRPATAQPEVSGPTATRAAELTEIAALRTQVAELQTRVAHQAAASPSPGPVGTPPPAILCGRPWQSWGVATADDIAVAVRQVQWSQGTPGNPRPRVAIAVTITNQSQRTLTYRLRNFELVDCRDGSATATAGGVQPAITDGQLASGATVQGWLTFPDPANVQPKRFVYHIEESGRTGARVECDLVDTSAPPASIPAAASGGKGCSAFGGSATG